jgi:hypothetical protein
MNLSPLPIQKFFDNNGRPLDGGLLFTYAAGTSVKAATYIDSSGVTPNANPIELDFRGECRLWIDPSLSYKYVLARSNDTDPPASPIWSVDNITASPANADNSAIDTGSVNNIALAIPQISAPVAFTRVIFKAANTNTSAVTLSINGGTAKAVKWQSTLALTGHEILANGLYEVVYDGAQWQLQGPTLDPYDARAFGAVGDGVTDDTTALRAWAASAAKGVALKLARGGTYVFDPSIVTNGVLFSGAAGFSVYGNGATIIAKAGASVVAQHEMMRFNNCQDFYVENLIIDANRANRTPVESTSHNINVEDSCARGTFNKVRCINAVTDGFYVGTDTGGTAATYPTDILFLDCIADNAYRNNMSIVASLRCTVRGGRYVNATGTSPQGGIDAEPDASITSGNIDLLIQDVELSDNVGYGLNIARSGGSVLNTRVTLRNIRGEGNTGGLIAISCVDGLDVDGVFCGPHSASTRGLVDIQNGSVENVTLRNLNFNGVTINATDRWLLYLFAANGRVVVDGFRAYDCPDLPCILSSVVTSITNVELSDVPDLAINLTGDNCIVRGLVCHTATGRVIYTTGDNTVLEDLLLIDCLVASSNSITVDTGGTFPVLRNITIRQTSSIPASAIGILLNEDPAVVQNVLCKSAGTDFTALNAISFAGGNTGSFIDGCSPSNQDFVTGILSPAQITANTNDYNPTGLAAASVLRLQTDASRNLTGLAGGADGRKIMIFNIGGFDLVITENDVASTAGNRFLMGGSVTLNPNEGMAFWYDGASTKWRSFGRSV